MFDAGGHELYLRCSGTGSPTVLYLHGYSADAKTASASADSGTKVEQAMPDTVRYCAYDRRNVARSGEADGVGTGVDAVADLHALLASAKVEPPYVLLGASWGGTVGYMYAATYPDEVRGMVLLDALFPDQLTLGRATVPEELLPTHEEYFTEDEKFDQVAAFEQAIEMSVPEIPVTYLLAMPFTFEVGVPEYDAGIRQTLDAYVAGFAPGELRVVKSPHWLEDAVPEAIVDEVTAMVDKAT